MVVRFFRRVLTHLGIGVLGEFATGFCAALAHFFWGWHHPSVLGCLLSFLSLILTACCALGTLVAIWNLIANVLLSELPGLLSKEPRAAPVPIDPAAPATAAAALTTADRHDDDGSDANDPDAETAPSASNTNTDTHLPVNLLRLHRCATASTTADLVHYPINWSALSERHPPERVAAMRRLAAAWKPFEGRLHALRKIQHDPLYVLNALSHGPDRIAFVTDLTKGGVPITTALDATAAWSNIERLAEPLLRDPRGAPAVHALLDLFVCDEAMARLVWVDVVKVLTCLTVWVDQDSRSAAEAAQRMMESLSSGLAQRARALLATVPSPRPAQAAPQTRPSDALHEACSVPQDTDRLLGGSARGTRVVAPFVSVLIDSTPAPVGTAEDSEAIDAAVPRPDGVLPPCIGRLSV